MQKPLPTLNIPVNFSGETTELTATYAIPNPQLWDEFSPNLYQLTVSLVDAKGQQLSEKAASFGMREIKAVGTRLAINGRPIFLRGDVDCAAFPLTGYPPTTEAPWEKIMKTAKEYGLNHLRFHSWCPPEAAFAVADRLGLYLHIESPLWANGVSAVGTGGGGRCVHPRRVGTDPSRIRQPPVVLSDGLRERAGWGESKRVSGALGGPFQAERRPSVVYQWRGLAYDSRKPVPRQPQRPHSAVGRGPQKHHQQRHSPHGLRLARRHEKSGRRTVRQPRNWPVVRLPELRRDAQIHRHSKTH